MKELKTIIVYADKVENLEIECYSFTNNEKDFNKLLQVCQKCKYFDQESDFPNCFCDKSCEMIDFHCCCSSKCPTGKWKIEQLKKEISNE